MSKSTMLSVARSQIGYLEKATGANLEDFTAGAGSANYTKYGAWYQGGRYQAQPWCDIFVSWVADQAGEAEAVGQFAYCPSHVDWFRRQGRYLARGSGTPEAGDVIFFTQGNGACHVGLVEAVNGGYVTTIEGNTSGASGLIPNGGGVCRKRYALTSSYILGYGRPAYTQEQTVKEEYDMAKTYQNGSTPEPVYADTALTVKIGSLNAYEQCQCLAKVAGRCLVYYPVDGTSDYKTGFVAYAGGL